MDLRFKPAATVPSQSLGQFSGQSIALCAALLCTLTVLTFPAGASDEAGAVEAALKNRIESLSEIVKRPAERDALNSFYGGRAYRPVWFDVNGPTRAARDAVRELKDAGSFGLTPSEFEMKDAAAANAGAMTPEQVVAAEFDLAAAIMRYARHARGGRIAEPDRMLSTYLDRRPVLEEPAAVLTAVAAAAHPDEALRSFHPPHQQFARLQGLLKKLQSAEPAAPDAKIALKGRLLLPGARNAEIAVLRRRLGVPAMAGAEEIYDGALMRAVKAFQVSAVLRADGVVGPATRKALSAGNADKIKSIVASMEQWRWMPRDLGKRHLLVNVPAFSIDFVADGNSKLQERVIVGKPETQTPIFSKNMTTMVLRPSWVLPDSIKLEKLLSAQRRGRHIENDGIVIKKGEREIKSWTIDWAKADLSHYAIYQPSGDGNALGDVKFLFPNKHSVYLHDTPNKSLFASEERLFSHGCVRLRNPLVLAQAVLDHDKGQDVIDVTDLVRHGPGSNQVMLDTPLPMHIGYFSAWVSAGGEAQFFGDPYGHDERIALALATKWDEIDKGANHLAKVETGSLKGLQFSVTPVEVIQDRRPETGLSPAQRNRAQAALSKARLAQPVAFPNQKKGWSKYSAREAGSVGALMNSAFMR